MELSSELIDKIVVNESEEADKESINLLNEKLQGHIEQETSILL